jgi:hypothetical protein
LQLPAQVSQPLNQCSLNVRVNVFERGRELHLYPLDHAFDLAERSNNLLGLFGGQQPHRTEHASVGLAGADIVPIEPSIDGDRFRERLDPLVSASRESSSPRLGHCVLFPRGCSLLRQLQLRAFLEASPVWAAFAKLSSL